MAYRSNAAEAWDPESDPSGSEPEIHVDLLPKSLNVPLWKSLLGNLRDTFAPKKLPPLQLTSRPVHLGMSLGDRLSLSWFRTVFTNIGDVISPETLPPLELESRPVDVGELITDQMSHFWWSSLLRSLADRAAPEKLPPLELTSQPVPDIAPISWMLLPMWSEALGTPKVFYPDQPKPVESADRPVVVRPAALPSDERDVRILDPAEAGLRRDLRRSRIRQRIWIALAAALCAYLILSTFLGM